jgi:predicted RNase H-like nuclease (RuvC/YqgF family)
MFEEERFKKIEYLNEVNMVKDKCETYKTNHEILTNKLSKREREIENLKADLANFK